MNRRTLLILVVSIAIPLSVGALGGFATAGSVSSWYTTLARPSFNPPAWVFGPVWTILYVLMGVALFLVWRRDASSSRNRALIVYAVQMALNLAWSFLFFGLQRPDWALVDIVLLDAAILATIHLFRRQSAGAAALLIPYLLWCLFATVLNAAIWQLNG